MKKIILPLLAFALALGACNKEISRNADGTFTVETSVTQEQLQEIVSAAIADPLVKSLTVALHSGYASVSGERERLNDPGKTDTMSFRLDLDAAGGKLTASISDAQIDGIAVEQSRVEVWNQTIANRLENLGGGREKASLQSVFIAPEQVAMTWIVTR